jgi:hypothetical protein
MRRTFILLVLSLAVLDCGRVPSGYDEKEYDEVARATLRDLEARRHAYLARQFCYPDSRRREEEEAWLLRSMSTLESRFGVATDFRDYRGVPNAHFAAIGAGSLDFWNEHQASIRYTVEVQFAKHGKGWIHLDLTSACGGSPQIKTIMYALPMETPGSKAFIDGIVEDLARSVSENQRLHETTSTPRGPGAG